MKTYVPGSSYRIATGRGRGAVKVLRVTNHEGDLYDAVVIEGSFLSKGGVIREQGDFICFRPQAVLSCASYVPNHKHQ